MKTRIGHGLLLVAMLLFCAPVADALFWRKGDKEETAEPVVAPGAGLQVAAAAEPGARRQHLRIQSSEAEQALVKLAAARQLREEELRVIGRLLDEKVTELARINAFLQERFDIAADRNYQFDREAGTIFELTPSEGDAGEPFNRREHRRLTEEDDATTFLKQVGAKNITSGEIQYLRLLAREKEIEVTRVYEQLEQQFKVQRDRHYEYEPAEKVLYEIVSPPGGVNQAVPKN